MSCIFFRYPAKCPVFFSGLLGSLIHCYLLAVRILLLHWHFLWLPMHCPYSQLYSVGGSSDAAVRYYSNLLMMNLMFAGEMPYVVELFCRRSTMSRCISLTLQFATTPDDTYAAAFEEFCSEKVWKPSCNLSVCVDTVITGVPSVLK